MADSKWKFREDFLGHYLNGGSSLTFKDAEDRLNYLEDLVSDICSVSGIKDNASDLVCMASDMDTATAIALALAEHGIPGRDFDAFSATDSEATVIRVFAAEGGEEYGQ